MLHAQKVPVNYFPCHLPLLTALFLVLKLIVGSIIANLLTSPDPYAF